MTKSKEPSESEIIFSRASLALARSQDIIKSWLPQAQGGKNGSGGEGLGGEGEEDDGEMMGLGGEEPET